MTLACQRNSYLKELNTKVKSCSPAELKLTSNGKKETVQGYEVILEDTVLFPEGGGQPDDRGTINDIPVLRITRRGADALNFVQTEIPVGTEVELKVDWTRRFDNMQQHSGQHLITAVAEKMYGYRTTTWYLGDKTSYIELDTPSMTTEQVSELEAVLNQKICEGIKVYPTYFEDKNDPKVVEFRTRGLPDDHVGPVRVMTIEGIDSCLCCGTHVSTTTDLQLIKLLGAERGKRKNSTNLNFVVGNRVLQYLGRCLEVEKSLTALLKGPLEQHYDLAEKAVKGYKNAQKATQTLLRDVAVLEAEKYKNNPKRDPVFVCHRKEGDIDFMNTLAREIGDQHNIGNTWRPVLMVEKEPGKLRKEPPTHKKLLASFLTYPHWPNQRFKLKQTECDLCFLTAGDDKGSGFVMMTGKENLVQDLAPKVMELMDGKGGCSKGRFQGKVNKLQHRQKAEQLIRNNLGAGDNQTP